MNNINLLFKLLKLSEKKAVELKLVRVFNKGNKAGIFKVADKVYKGLTMGVEDPLISKEDFRIIPQVVRGDESAVKKKWKQCQVLGSRVNSAKAKRYVFKC